MRLRDLALWGAGGYVLYRALGGGAGLASSIVDDASFIRAMWAATGASGAPTAARVYMVAQAAHETEWGDQGTFAQSNNAFNIISRVSPDAPRGSWQGPEVQGDDVDASGAPTSPMWRAYSSLAESVADFLSLLQRRYPGAYAQLMVGDPQYVYTLYAGGYFQQSPATYYGKVTSYADAVKAALGLA